MRLEAKTACVFLCQLLNSDVRKKPEYTDAFWVSILLMVEIILNKNKNKSRVEGVQGLLTKFMA